jgi:2-polyprenyl-3-methyl-5-hydroxy-6-metoxy-1,4-benzoquinol methylase
MPMPIDRRYIQTQVGFATDDLHTMREARRYQSHVLSLLRPYIGSRILEVGSGIGTTTRTLVDIADHVVGIEPNRSSVTHLLQAIGGHPRFELHACHLEECDRTALVAARFDTVLCVNVLEHIQDDEQALRDFAEIAAPANGHVVIYVPAVRAAYGPLDAALGHHRRYSRRSLARLFAAARLDIEVLKYTNPMGLLAWMFNTYVTRKAAHSPRQIALFEALVAPWALPLERLVPMPVGLSLVAVGRPQRRST